MTRMLAVLYGLTCYVAFFATFLYAIAFVEDVGVPWTVDRGHSSGMGAAVLIDLVLLGMFAIQHSGMARSGFKGWLARMVPASIERSTYVLVSSVVLALLFWQWRPIPGVVWQADAAWAVNLLYAISALGWFIVLSSTFLINHFDLFGLRQVWLAAREKPYRQVPFVEGLYYRVVRHPLMSGFIIAFWSTPRMTLGHLLFAAASTGYILVAVKFMEEPDLVRFHGEDYRQYQQRVPMLCPWPRPHPKSEASGRPPH